MVLVGIDWSETSHDVVVMNESGRVLRRLRVRDGVDGAGVLQEAISEQESDPAQVVVGIESSHGLLVNSLLEAGYQVYAINPLVAARHRERHSIAGAKSDPGDARMLADLIRTDRHQLQPIRGDSEEAQAVRKRARSHERAVRERVHLRNRLRSALIEFYPAALPLLEEHSLRDALAVLAMAPNPVRGRALSVNKIASALRRAGRQRNLEARAAEIQGLLRTPQLQLPPKLASAHSDEVAHLVRLLVQLEAELVTLEEQLAAAFREHPDAEIFLSFPGLGDTLGARVLGESGDDPARYRNARARQNYSGNSPVTRASGKSRAVTRRVRRNRRLADAGFLWAYASLTRSPGARNYYDRLRTRQRSHNQALRALANKLTSILHACLRDHRPYSEDQAWMTFPHEVAA